MNGAYYNEIDPFAAQWLRNLIAAGHIAPGDVDERSIVDVVSADLLGYTQCHFFAGIGVWSYALRRVGWPDDRPVWTGSCPCQPFSAAGKQRGTADERHLWPEWFRLIRECEQRPHVIFGEQVASKHALAWFDHVQNDLEGEGYAVGAIDSCAAGYGAPHIRQRLYWVADREGERRSGWPNDEDSGRRERASGHSETRAVADTVRDATRQHVGQLSRDESEHVERAAQGDHRPRDRGATRAATRAVADTDDQQREAGRRFDGGSRGIADASGGGIVGHTELARLEGHAGHVDDRHGPGRERTDEARPATEAGAVDELEYADGRGARAQPGDHREAGEEAARGTRPDDGAAVPDRAGAVDDMEHSAGVGREESKRGNGDEARRERQAVEHRARGPTNGFWSDAEWIACRDGKVRPTEPGTFPLAHGVAQRVGRLRAYGNAIVAPQAEAFIRAYLSL